MLNWFLLKEILTLKRDFESLLVLNNDDEALEKLYEEFEFKPLKNSPVKKTAEEVAVVNSKYETIDKLEDLEKWAKQLDKCTAFAIDTETSSLDTITADLLGISLSIEEGKGCYVPIGHDYDGAPKQLSLDKVVGILGKSIETNQKKAVGQNLKFDIPILARHGIKLSAFLADTMLMSYVLNSTGTRHSMDRMAEHYLQLSTIKYTDVTGTASKQINFSKVDIATATNYAAEDADITLRLYKHLEDLLKGQNSQLNLLEAIEYPLVLALVTTETNGAKIDKDKLAAHSKELGEKIEVLTKEAYKLGGQEFNLDSPKQLLEILYEKQGLPVLQKTPKGQPSTNEATLQRLAEEYDLPKVILEYRTLAKLKSTYTDSLIAMENPVTKRIHTSYHQAVTSTGRLSSTEPNLQNIPIKTSEGRRIREAFVPEKGNVLISADYSQIELRIMAHLSGDKNLTNAFNNNLDVHSATAAEIFRVDIKDVDSNQRRSAKAINFGLMYGMSAFGLTKQLDITRAEAQSYLDTYFERYTGVRDYMDNVRAEAKKDLYVQTIMGRRLYVNEINAANGLRRQAAERAAINAPLQGSAADIIKKAMLDVDTWIANEASDTTKMIMQVHDELILEAKKSESEEVLTKVKEIMEAAVDLDIPLIVEASIGSNWNEAH